MCDVGMCVTAELWSDPITAETLMCSTTQDGGS